MSNESFQEKTEKATPKRIREAREKGQVARSQELSAVGVLMLGIVTLLALGPYLAANLKGLTSWVFTHATEVTLTPSTTKSFFIFVSWTFAKSVAPIIGMLGVIAFAVSYLQVGALFSSKAIEPKFDKLNIIKGMKNLIGVKSLVNLTKDVLKLTIIAFVAFYSVKKEIPTLLTLPDMAVPQIASMMLEVASRVALKVTSVLIAIGAADYAWQRFDYFRNLKMTKQELKDEYKDTEGNPLIKSRIKSVQRDQARKRMMADVPEADVIITNPTHIAIALKYDQDKMEAPTIVAKGQRLIAEAIKKIAEEAGIPIVENKPLARTLFKTVEIGMIVPAHLFKAVAEVLAYVYNLKNNRGNNN